MRVCERLKKRREGGLGVYVCVYACVCLRVRVSEICLRALKRKWKGKKNDEERTKKLKRL